MNEEPVSEAPLYGSVEVTYSVADIGALMLDSWYIWLIAPALVMVMLLVIQLGFPMHDGASLQEAFETVGWGMIGFFGILIFLFRLATLAFRHAWRRLRRRPDEIHFELREEGHTLSRTASLGPFTGSESGKSGRPLTAYSITYRVDLR